ARPGPDLELAVGTGFGDGDLHILIHRVEMDLGVGEGLAVHRDGARDLRPAAPDTAAQRAAEDRNRQELQGTDSCHDASSGSFPESQPCLPRTGRRRGRGGAGNAWPAPPPWYYSTPVIRG